MSMHAKRLLMLLLAGCSPLGAPAVGRCAEGAFLPVGDPLEAELRVLEVWPPGGVPPLPHVSTLPMQRREALGTLTGLPRAGLDGSPRSLALRRLAREWARDRAPHSEPAPGGATPRLLDRTALDGSRIEGSLGLVGSASFRRERDMGYAPDWTDGSGVRARLTASVGPWLAHADLAAGHLAGVRAYSDALIEGRDVALSTDDSYLAIAPSDRWDARIGRSRTHWGPGEEASLLLSRTGPSLSALTLRGRIAPLSSDLTVLHATTDPGRGEQLAAHRIEWSPRPGLRVGLAEAARYRSSGWQAVYLASVIPFSVVQRLLDQDAASPDDSLRNNVLVAVDAAWRIADGTRVYGELLVDDVHARSSAFPDKWGYQLGLDGAGPWGRTRLSWNAEFTRLSRYVYTSYYGRSHTARGLELGHPIGPDARRLRVRVSWDIAADWQVSGFASQTDRGESGLAESFVPGAPVQDPMTFAGVVERTRLLEGELRWWPATGIDASVRLGLERIRDAGHVAGQSRSGIIARAGVALWR